MNRYPYIVSLVLALFLHFSAAALGSGLGFYNSFKGFGLCLDQLGLRGQYVDSYVLYADLYGITSSRTNAPGVKFNFTREYVLRVFEGEDLSYVLYFGPGVSLGYLRDYEAAYLRDSAKPLLKNPGVMAALSGRGGCRFSFLRNVDLDFSFTVEAGLHLHRNETQNSISVGLYKNGFIQAIYPQLSIIYFFR